VRRTLHEHQLLQKPRPNPSGIPQPRCFERATPNQLWQTDIFTFRLGGKNAYLIGFLDDPSRYVVGLDVFRSQTAEHVLEVYRRAVAGVRGAHGAAHDQGRQFASWRGTTLKSRPTTHDAGQDRALLEDDLGGVPGARAVRPASSRPASGCGSG